VVYGHSSDSGYTRPGVPPQGMSCPVSHPIKGNFTTHSGERCIHHMRRQLLSGRTKIGPTGLVVLSFLAPAMSSPDPAGGQSDLLRAQNLATCLSGKFSSLCKREWLTAEDFRKTDSAERQENLRVCLTGKYPSLCRREKLSPQEIEAVVVAEREENRRVCLTGRYKILCRGNLLSETERKDMLLAERRENARVCLTGRYPALCDKSLITQEELLQTSVAELGDGSVWKVDTADVIDSALWLPISDIVVCDGKLINTDDNETVSARRIR